MARVKASVTGSTGGRAEGSVRSVTGPTGGRAEGSVRSVTGTSDGRAEGSVRSVNEAPINHYTRAASAAGKRRKKLQFRNPPSSSTREPRGRGQMADGARA